MSSTDKNRLDSELCYRIIAHVEKNPETAVGSMVKEINISLKDISREKVQRHVDYLVKENIISLVNRNNYILKDSLRRTH